MPSGALDGKGAGTKVAFVVANQLEAGLTAVSVQTGNQRCHTAELVVTDTLAPLTKKRGQVCTICQCAMLYTSLA